MHNIVCQLKNNLNFTGDLVHPHTNYFEGPVLFDQADGDDEYKSFGREMDKTIDALDALPSPRLIKSHLPAILLPHEIWTVKPKLIYMSRDAKDVAVSCYHMMRNIMVKYKGSSSDFYHTFFNDYMTYGPFYEHIQSYTQLRHLDHLLLMTYEELSADTFACVKRVADFLNCSYSEEELHKLVDFVSFKKMRDKIDFASKDASDAEYR